MTAYQRKRQVLNKINARTRSMAKKYDLDRHTIAEKAIDGLDGVYVDEEYGTINITKGFESEELYDILEKNVLTNTRAEAKAIKAYEDFVGPLRKNQIYDEVRSMYSFETEIEDIVKTYYDLEASIKQRPWDVESNKVFKEFEDKLSNLGKQWHDELPYSVLQDLLNEVKQLKGDVKLRGDLT